LVAVNEKRLPRVRCPPCERKVGLEEFDLKERYGWIDDVQKQIVAALKGKVIRVA
jgi:hypothetical protein